MKKWDDTDDRVSGPLSMESFAAKKRDKSKVYGKAGYSIYIRHLSFHRPGSGPKRPSQILLSESVPNRNAVDNPIAVSVTRSFLV